MTDEAMPELPGRREAGAIADWAEHRRAAGEFGPEPGPRAIADGGVMALREVDGDNVRAISALQVSPPQRRNVAPNAVSIAEAAYAERAWLRGIYVDDAPVGLVLVSIDTAEAEYYLWRLMIDERYQGLGYGRAALALVTEHVRTLPNARELYASWVPGPDGPEGFYLGLGFEPTGQVEQGEAVGRLAL